MKIGETIYLKPIGNAARRSSQIREAIIETVGRKYFTVKPDIYGKFDISTMKQVSFYDPEWQGYLHKQDILDEKELADKRKLIKEYSFNLDQCREILKLIESKS